MTGFARVQGQEETCSWTWEVKSVNGKGRDIRCRVPGGLESLDPQARERVAKRFHRGNFSLTLNLVRNRSKRAFQVNTDVLEQVLAVLPEISRHLPDAQPPRVDGILALSGVMEALEEEPDEKAQKALEDSLLAGLDRALEALAAMRAEEGGRLEPVLVSLLNTISSLTGKAEGLAAAQPDAIRERLREQVAALLETLPALPEERLAQEAALLITKADLREELDRLKAHVVAARELIGETGSIGRKLDFLCQEFNREANTLCSKSADVELTRVGLDLKAAIEQFREQVQNIE